MKIIEQRLDALEKRTPPASRNETQAVLQCMTDTDLARLETLMVKQELATLSTAEAAELDGIFKHYQGNNT